jgi:hypothetical protein
MDISANLLIDDVLQVRQMLDHSILYPESIESSKFINKLGQKKEAISKILPNIKW